MATNASAPGAGRAAAPFKPLDDDAKSKVKAQIEFYFSDSNLPRDKFLRETVEADPEGFVDIGLLVTFSRMRALLAPFGGSHNEETVAAVTELLQTSDSLTVSDDKKRIRRTSELRSREEVDAEVEQRSVYASPFPMTATIDELTDFFSKHASVRSVRLRRHISSKDFKGSIFVELADAAACRALIEGEKLTHEGAELTIMMKKDYLEKKKADRVERAAANAAGGRAGRGGGEGGGRGRPRRRRRRGRGGRRRRRPRGLHRGTHSQVRPRRGNRRGRAPRKSLRRARRSRRHQVHRLQDGRRLRLRAIRGRRRGEEGDRGTRRGLALGDWREARDAQRDGG